MMKQFLLLCSIVSVTYAMGQTGNTVDNKPQSKLSLEEPQLDRQLQRVPMPTITDENYVFSTYKVQVKPEFPEGTEAMYAFIKKNYVVPKEILTGGKTQTVYVTFIVEKDGSLSNRKVIRDAGYDTAKEALRVLALMPNWLPGEHDGKHVRCSYTIPIRLHAE